MQSRILYENGWTVKTHRLVVEQGSGECCEVILLQVGARVGDEGRNLNVGDSVKVLIHVERRPGKRFVSEVLELKRYDPDSDLFDYAVVYTKERQE